MSLPQHRASIELWDSDSHSDDSAPDAHDLLISLPAQQVHPKLLSQPHSRAQRLTRLIVTQTDLSAFSLDLVNSLPSLRHLDLSRNKLTRVSAPESGFDFTPPLTQLILSQNRLSNLPDSFLISLPQLRSLSLFSNRLTALPSSLSTLSLLRCLHVFANRLSALPPECASLFHLNELTLGTIYGGNPLSIDSWAADLSLLSSLTRLALENTPVSSLPPSFLRFPCYILDATLRLIPIQIPSVTDAAVQTVSLFPPAGSGPLADAVPDAFYCPISMALLKEPVVAADGFTYERTEIQRWVKLGRPASPMTNRPLSSTVLHPNRVLASWMKDFFEKNSHLCPIDDDGDVEDANVDADLCNVVSDQNNSNYRSANRNANAATQQSQTRQSPVRGSAGYNTTPPSLQRHQSASSLISSARGSRSGGTHSPSLNGPRSAAASPSPARGCASSRDGNASQTRNLSRPRSAR